LPKKEQHFDLVERPDDHFGLEFRSDSIAYGDRLPVGSKLRNVYGVGGYRARSAPNVAQPRQQTSAWALTCRTPFVRFKNNQVELRPESEKVKFTLRLLALHQHIRMLQYKNN
jgi:hypothetical protein